MKAITQRMTNALCFGAFLLAIAAFLVSCGAQFYWMWGDHWLIWDLNRLKLLTLTACVVLLILAGVIKLADVHPIATLSTSCLLLLTYGVQFLDTTNWTSHPSRTSGQYTFTTDWVTANQAIWSEKLAALKGRPNLRALEVGSFEGRSAIWFLENILTDPSSSIVCIDVFDGTYERLFDSNLGAFKSQFTKIKAFSQDGLRTLPPKSFDFIYIDGSHVAKDVFIDTALSWDLLKPEGFIIFDDYNWKGRANHGYGIGRVPKLALDAFLTVFAPYLAVQHKDYQLIVKKLAKPDYNSPQLIAVPEQK